MVLLGICYSAMAVTEKTASNPALLSSGLQDQTGVAVTVYNVNLGLVKDKREIRLPRGKGDTIYGCSFKDYSNKCLYQVAR